ncbi:MAG: hypothetical protein OXC28_05025 [Defluviicoccus sp.]|nr:hypothetical protein [Defluviicoccus sp.]
MIMKIRPECLGEVQHALEKYREIVERTALAPNTKHTYLLHAENFVRWLRDEFEPGRTLR